MRKSSRSVVATRTDPSRKTFGKLLAQHGTIIADIARMRIEIDQARLFVLSAANIVDKKGAKGAMKEIGMIKVIISCLLVLYIITFT